MSRKIFFKLLIIYFLCSILGAILGWLIFIIFPQFIAKTVKYYGYLQEFIGIKHWEKQPSINSALITILIGNGLSTLAIFVVGLLSWGKTISFLIGMFMSFILFTGSIRHGNPINFNIVALMIAEMTYRILTVSLGSFLTTDFSDRKFKYKRSFLKSCSQFISSIYHKNRNILNEKRKLKISIGRRNIPLILIVTIIIAILLVGAAFFEVLAKI
jgi:membrane protein YqaA with SNARE-associated domain